MMFACSSRSGPKKKPRAPLGQYNVGNPMERIAIDVLGPLLLFVTLIVTILSIADFCML